MRDLPHEGLTCLYKQKHALEKALQTVTERHSGGCEDCRTVQKLKDRIKIIDWLIDAAWKAVK